MECCVPEAAGFTIRSWTGEMGMPITSFNVKPWYNSIGFSTDSCGGRPMCSACIDADTDDFRTISDQKPVQSATQPACVCDASKAWEDGCPPADLPYVVSCGTWCCGAWKAQFLCQLPKGVGSAQLPGPCAEYNGRKLEKKLQCTSDGYYSDLQSGLMPPQNFPGAKRPTGSQMAWCTDPSTGVQNSSTAVAFAQRLSLNCADTVRCEKMNRHVCQGQVGRRYCNWVSPIGAYGGAGCLPIAQKNRCEAVLAKLCSGMQPSVCLTCAGKQQSTLRSVGCTHAEIESHCNKSTP